MNSCIGPLDHTQSTRSNKYAARIQRVSVESRERNFFVSRPQDVQQTSNSPLPMVLFPSFLKRKAQIAAYGQLKIIKVFT